jgi:hypothetical protein
MIEVVFTQRRIWNFVGNRLVKAHIRSNATSYNNKNLGSGYFLWDLSKLLKSLLIPETVKLDFKSQFKSSRPQYLVGRRGIHFQVQV